MGSYWTTADVEAEQEQMRRERNAAADEYEAQELESKIGPARELKALNANLRELIELLRERLK